MKIKGLILFILLSLISVNIFSQTNVLKLNKRNADKTKTINEGKKIRIITTDKKKINGKFEIIDNKNISIDQDTLTLQEIEIIRKKSTASKIIGGIFTGEGLFITYLGSVLLIQSMAEAPIVAVFYIMFGVPITSLGIFVTATGSVILFSGKKYKNNKWIYEIEAIEKNNE